MSYAAPLFSRLARSLACVCARGSAPSTACSPGHHNPFNLRRSTPRSATGADFIGQHRQRRELGQCVCARNQKRTLYERFETHGDDVPFPPQTEKKEFENLILNASKTANFLFTVCSKKNDNYFVICRWRRESTESGGI